MCLQKRALNQANIQVLLNCSVTLCHCGNCRWSKGTRLGQRGEPFIVCKRKVTVSFKEISFKPRDRFFWRLTFHQTRLPPESSDLSTEPYVLDPYRGSSVDKGTMVEGTYDPSALCFQVWLCLVQGAQCQQNK